METRRVVIIGGGAAGLHAAYTLKKHNIDHVLLESDSVVGGRLGGDQVDGFSLDQGADFFTPSYDVTFELCEELNIPLICSQMNLGWYTRGEWNVTKPVDSLGKFFEVLPSFWNLGFLSPPIALAFMKIIRNVKRNSEHLNFSSQSRIAEIDDGESFEEFMQKIGVNNQLRMLLGGFLEMTMGRIEECSAGYMLTYISEMLLKASTIYVPEKGVGALKHALANVCEDSTRVSTPVLRVITENETATGVATDDGIINADVVICAVPAIHVSTIIPELPTDVATTLDNVTYSTGCRVIIGLDHPPLPPGWHGAIYPEDETPLMLDRTINLPKCAPPGKSTLDLLVGRARAEELILLDDDEIKRQMLSNVHQLAPPGSNLPGFDDGIFTRVYRWKEAVCMMSPGLFRKINNIQHNIRNLILAGDYTKVPSVNGALASGKDAAMKAVELLRPSLA